MANEPSDAGKIIISTHVHDKEYDSDKIHYHVTREIEDIEDTDGLGTYNISPIGFPKVDVSSTISQIPTRFTPNFYVSYHNQLSGETPAYTEYNNNIENIVAGGLRSFSIGITLSGTGTIVIATTIGSKPHGYTNGKTVTIAGASPSGFNGDHIITVIDANTFRYSAAALGTATGTITSTYTLVTGDLIRIAAQDDFNIDNENGWYKNNKESININGNGWYKAKEGPWQRISIDVQETKIIKSNTTADIPNLFGIIPIVHTVVSLIGNGTLATCVTRNLKDINGVDVEQGHGLTTGDSIVIAGAVQSNFNGTKVITVVNKTTFTYVNSNNEII